MGSCLGSSATVAARPQRPDPSLLALLQLRQRLFRGLTNAFALAELRRLLQVLRGGLLVGLAQVHPQVEVRRDEVGVGLERGFEVGLGAWVVARGVAAD